MDSRIFLGKPRRCRLDSSAFVVAFEWRTCGSIVRNFHCALNVIWKIAIIHFDSLSNRILCVPITLSSPLNRLWFDKYSLSICGFLPPPTENNSQAINGTFYNEELKHFFVDRDIKSMSSSVAIQPAVQCVNYSVRNRIQSMCIPEAKIDKQANKYDERNGKAPPITASQVKGMRRKC